METVEPEPGWRVLKFGGTSVGRAANWLRIAAIASDCLADGHRPMLVCSALSGVTDALADALLSRRRGEHARAHARRVRDRHAAFATEASMGLDDIEDDLSALERWADQSGVPTAAESAAVLALGERMSTRLGKTLLRRHGLSARWLDARDLLTASSRPTGEHDEAHYLSARCEHVPDRALAARLAALPEQVAVTQGFVARDAAGDTVVLGRGGSDTSAAYLGALLGASRVEIWTDVPGTFTTNPNEDPRARLIRDISVDEVASLAGLGARVLHPRSIEVVRQAGVSLDIRWIARPDLGAGTRIRETCDGEGILAVTMREKLCALRMERPPTWQPVGFMADVARCFNAAGLSMDLIASSPSVIWATVDVDAFPNANSALGGLLEALAEVCQPTVHKGVASVSVVGRDVNRALDKVSGVLSDIPPDAMLFAAPSADGTHLTYVVDGPFATRLVKELHDTLVADVQQGTSWLQLCQSEEPAA